MEKVLWLKKTLIYKVHKIEKTNFHSSFKNNYIPISQKIATFSKNFN